MSSAAARSAEDQIAVVESYAAALSAANSALNTLNNTSAATELYAFEYDSNLGYLFIDSDSDGEAEDLNCNLLQVSSLGTNF